MYDYKKLRGRIVEIFNTQQEFARQLGCSEHTLSNKLNGNVEWRQSEILRAIALLQLKTQDIIKYFFTTKVQ